MISRLRFDLSKRTLGAHCRRDNHRKPVRDSSPSKSIMSCGMQMIEINCRRLALARSSVTRSRAYARVVSRPSASGDTVTDKRNNRMNARTTSERCSISTVCLRQGRVCYVCPRTGRPVTFKFDVNCFFFSRLANRFVYARSERRSPAAEQTYVLINWQGHSYE